MDSAKDWNPILYLKFKNERTQPSLDLISKINILNPEKIIDIGCGPGNSTEILLKKWQNSKITGIDNSPAMIEKAKNDHPEQIWKIQDASNIGLKEKYDIVFSNATIQWIPDHERLLLNFINMVKKNGALAVQLPLYNEMPICEIIDNVFKKVQSGKQKFDLNSVFTFHNSKFYYDVLINHVEQIEIWETTYIHIMNSCKEIIEMIKSTGMKPYLEKINEDKEKIEFEERVFSELNKVYIQQKNGKVLFPFKRLFFIAYK
jgi:trans-aconitate 2-methyltransferase